MNDQALDARENAMWSAYRTELLAFVRRRLRDAHLAEDIVQEVLAKGYVQHEHLRDPSRLRSWLYQSTRNALIDYYRKAKPAEELPEDLAESEGLDAPRVETELARCLTSLIQNLPTTYREAIVLSELQDVRQKEVAGRLGLSFSGAKSRVQRGRHLLREMFSDCCDIELDVRGRLMDHQCQSGCGCSS